MKIGLIGYGAWGSHHATAIAGAPGLELAGICARSEDPRLEARRRFGVPTAETPEELLRTPGLEAVSIVLPTHLHLQAAAAALKRGLHVLLEKPMALTPAECDELMAVWRDSGRVLYVGHEFRLSTQWGGMRELIAEGAVGKPLCATIDLWRRPYRRGSGSWRYDRNCVGSWVLEEPIHFFDAVCWWMEDSGRPTSVYAAASRLPDSPPDLWNNMHATLRFESGAHATVTQTLAVLRAPYHRQSHRRPWRHSVVLGWRNGPQRASKGQPEAVPQWRARGSRHRAVGRVLRAANRDDTVRCLLPRRSDARHYSGRRRAGGEDLLGRRTLNRLRLSGAAAIIPVYA
jgi:predicted dehydrogenase